jgi:phosphate transport system substrate-binding protein
MRKIMSMAALAGALALASAPGFAADISGAGATFPYPIYAKWADAYKKETGNGLNYQSIGSGGGIKQIQAKTVTFGASDLPLKGDALEKDGLVQFPMVIGGLVPVINIEGVKAGGLILDGTSIADIYLGKIKSWDDAAIKKLNPEVSLPALPIVVVRRSDGSGSTFLWTDYLSKISAEWKTKVGSNSAVEWPVGIGAKGNEGVANNVMQTKGALGYVEFAYAKVNKIPHARVINAAGKAVEPGLASFQAAAANAKWETTPGMGEILTNQPGDATWPIAGASFILMHMKPADAAASDVAIKFFDWAFTKGADMATELDYVPMPASAVAQVKKEWAKISK